MVSATPPWSGAFLVACGQLGRPLAGPGDTVGIPGVPGVFGGLHLRQRGVECEWR
jgi:hypothetical protein